MAFNINPGKQQFSATASQTVFTFNFAIFAGTDIKVYKTLAGAVANDTTDLLTIATHYTVSINGTLGGTVTLLSGASLNDTITIVRVLPITRSTDYVTNGDLYADTLDLDQDYQTYLTADADVQLQRAIIVPESLSGVSLSIPAPIADTYLRWNVTATALENDATIPQKLIDATTQAGIATTQAGIATTQAGIATTQAGLSTASATEAEHWANYTTDVAVPEGTGEFSAKHYATKAAQSLAGLSIDAVPTDASANAVSSNGVFDALALKASLSSPALTETPTAPTAPVGTNTTQIATTAFVLANGGASKQIQPITASVAANALTITLNATSLDFRSSTLSNGTVNTRTVASPISMTVSSGSTLGTTSAISARLVLIAIDNSGTVELAITNLSGGLNLDETALISTVAEGGAGASDLANVIYSTSARTNVPFRVVGFIDITEATAGTWATSPSTIQGSGGQALVGFNKLTLGVAVASTSGTSIDFIGIPSTAKKITVILSGVSTTGANPVLIQIGSTTVSTTGYLGANSYYASTIGSALNTDGLKITMGAEGATSTRVAVATINNIDGNGWVLNGSGANATTASGGISNSSITLAGVLDRIRITTVGGTDTFDAGKVNIMYEG